MKQKVDKVIAGIIRGVHTYNDTVLGAGLLILSVSMFIMSFSIKIMKAPVSDVDTARFFPQMVFGALIPLSIILIVRGILRAKTLRESAPEGEVLDARITAFKRAIVALVAIAVFILLLEPVGFIPMAILYMLFNMFYMCEKAAWKPVLFVIVAVVIAVAVYFLFKKFVYVTLPGGILKGVLG